MKKGFAGSFIFVVVLFAAFSSLGFGAACTTWMLGNATTTIAPNMSLTGSVGDPCQVGPYTFSNFYVFNGPTSTTPISVGVGFSPSFPPAVLTFAVANSTATTDFDAVYDVNTSFSSVTISDTSATGMIDFTICSVRFVNGQSCTGQGGTVLGSGILTGSASVIVPLLLSPTGNDWFFEDVSGTTSFSNTFVPEPVTSSLMGLGLLAIGFAGRKRMRKD